MMAKISHQRTFTLFEVGDHQSVNPIVMHDYRNNMFIILSTMSPCRLEIDLDQMFDSIQIDRSSLFLALPLIVFIHVVQTWTLETFLNRKTSD